MNSNGALVISLDFELLWGVFDKVDWEKKKDYFHNTRKVIPMILQLFEEYEISCTWATVGMLFNHNWDEWNQNIPDILPDYENNKLSAYNYGKAIQNKETEALCFAPDLIKRIKETPGQEIGTHTYSHYYCLEPGQIQKTFKVDLQKNQELAKKNGISLKSLVFPRNQYNKDYLSICKENGIQTVRTNFDVWYWQNTQKNSLQQKVFRTADAYVGCNNKSYKEVPELIPGILGQKASRLLRPLTGNTILDKKHVFRIKSEISKAAKKGEIYHLWWHPHNFGANPEKSMSNLKSLLKHFVNCRKYYCFKSFNMNEIPELKKFK